MLLGSFEPLRGLMGVGRLPRVSCERDNHEGINLLIAGKRFWQHRPLFPGFVRTALDQSP